MEPCCPRRPPLIEMLVAEVSSDCKYMQVRAQGKKKNAVIAEGKEGKMFLGGVEMFSVQVIKNPYCCGITLVCRRYVGCSEVGFSQLNRAAETEIMIPVFPLSAWSTRSLGSTLAASQKQKRHQHF